MKFVHQRPLANQESGGSLSSSCIRSAFGTVDVLTRMAVVVIGGDCGTRQMAGARGAKMGRGVLIGQWPMPPEG